MAGPDQINRGPDNLGDKLPKPTQKNPESGDDSLDTTESRLATLERELVKEAREAAVKKPKESVENPDQDTVSPPRSLEAERMEKRWAHMAENRPDEPVKTFQVLEGVLDVLSDELPEAARDLASRAVSILGSNDPKDRDLDPKAAHVAGVIEAAQANSDPQKVAEIFVQEVMKAV